MIGNIFLWGQSPIPVNNFFAILESFPLHHFHFWGKTLPF